MSTLEEKYVFTTPEESVLNKDWAAGSKEQIHQNEFIIKKSKTGYIGEYTNIKYSPAWLKIIDEPIVNALDHIIRTLDSPHKVTCIKVNFTEDGRVRVYNDGPGVEVAIHSVASEKLGREVYAPTFIFGLLFQGSNRTKPDDCIIGGTNGIGSKLSNIFSTEFIVETVDVKRKKFFIQQWRNNMSIAETPIIVDLNSKEISRERKVSHTVLSFMPDYSRFGYKTFGVEEYNKLVDVVRTRVIFAAAYAKSCSDVKVYFNDELININGIRDIAGMMFPGCETMSAIIKPDLSKAKNKNFKYDWDVCVVFTDSTNYDSNQLTNVNGMVVKEGKHIKHLFNDLVSGVKDKIIKLFKDKELNFSNNYVTGNIYLLANTKIPNPNWVGQRKDVVDTDIRNFAGYKFDSKFTSKIADKLKDRIIDSIFASKTATENKRKRTVDYDKYTPARLAGGKHSLKCGLIFVEGDSAMTQVATGISNTVGFERYGLICTGGVIVNARKECSVMETSNGKFVKKSTKLTNNLFMRKLMDVTGLNPESKYDKLSPTYKKEMNKLNYGSLIACVDQDLDGKGNILGLVLNLFELLWPNLLRDGYVKWFATPIIRAYPKTGGKLIEFYTIEDYKKWATSGTDKYNIKYYKGIGTHSRTESINMFKSFESRMYTYYMDERSHEMFEVYFGIDPDLRKAELSKPTRMYTPDIVFEQETKRSISCSNHLEYETNMYQKDNLERKLDHVIDGQNQAGRKILDGVMKAFKATNSEMRVAQLAGEVSKYENYHHGEASLCDSITGKGFIGVGGKQLPIIVPLSCFGSRKGGGRDAAQPRYIKTKYNAKLTDIIYPAVDYHILEFNFDEGERSEPKHFVPIIPTAILESTELPAHGWKLKTWGRDVFKVIENVRRMIRNSDNVSLLATPPYTHGWKGTMRYPRGELYSFGDYEYLEKRNVIKITELPLRVWTDDYFENLRKKAATDNKIIASLRNESDDMTVRIEVELKPGAYELLDEYADSCYSDGVEEYFQLRNRMDSHINLMGPDGSVMSFKSYEDVMYHWFPVRKEYYRKRIERQIIILKLKIISVDNIIKYVNACNDMKISRRKYSEMVKILEENKFARIYRARLNSPEFTPTEELEDLVLNSDSADYKYLLDLPDSKKSEESLEKYIEQLSDLNAELEELKEVSSRGRFIGAYIWERELDALEKVIRHGQKTEWLYDEYGKYEY
jgi:DNA topoisomerase-2